MIRAVTGVGMVLAALTVVSPARAEVVWLCKPGADPNPCVGSNRTTVQTRGAADRIEDPANPADPPVDCFYVYPTVSNQPSVNATKAKDAELFAVARQQAQRFSLRCKVYAPVYRQRTIASIYFSTPEQQGAALQIAYADVVEAFKEYLARHNDGRGFVLLGHSQGSLMLRMLIRDELDADAAVRARLVSAFLPGANVLVRKGRLSGGDFAHVPACTRDAQTRCVVAWHTFGDPPPDDTRFGRAPATPRPGSTLPAGPDFEALCNNPASLAMNEREPVHSLYRPELFPGIVGPFSLRQFNFRPPMASTPWVRPADRYSARCETSRGANVLMVHPLDGAQKLSPAPDDTWGLHLIDVNVVLGDLIDLVARQTEAYLAGPARRLRLAVSCTRAGPRIRLRNADATVRTMTVRLRGRRVAVDRRAPFSARIARRHLRRGAPDRVDVRVARRGAPSTRLTATLRRC